MGPGEVDVRGPDEGFGLEGTPKTKNQRDPPPPKKETLFVGRRCAVVGFVVRSILRSALLRVYAETALCRFGPETLTLACQGSFWRCELDFLFDRDLSFAEGYARSWPLVDIEYCFL